MNETVTVTATKGKDGKLYYFSSTGEADPNSPFPLDTKRIAKSEFDRLARRAKKNFDKEYNEAKELIKFKYIDDRLEQWQKQDQRAAERKKRFEKENKKLGCAGIFIIGISSFLYLAFKILI